MVCSDKEQKSKDAKMCSLFRKYELLSLESFRFRRSRIKETKVGALIVLYLCID